MRAKHKGRFTGSMAIVLAGLALMAGGREAGAQTLTELVSNRMTGSGAGRLVCAACIGESRRGQNDGSSGAYAQAFTTGPGGATLHSIDMRVRLRTNEPQTPTLEIRRGAPRGPLVATLNGPTITVTRQTRVRTFVAPAATELAAMTMYFVVVKYAEIIVSSTGSTWQRAAAILTPRVSETALGEHRIELHRNQQTVTVTIEVEDNDIAQGETIIEAELVRHADTHEQLMIQNAKKRFTIYDEDGWEFFFDLPCDDDIRVTEGVDSHVTIPLRVTTPAPEFLWGSVLVALAGSAVPGSDYNNTSSVGRRARDSRSANETGEQRSARRRRIL